MPRTNPPPKLTLVPNAIQEAQKQVFDPYGSTQVQPNTLPVGALQDQFRPKSAGRPKNATLARQPTSTASMSDTSESTGRSTSPSDGAYGMSMTPASTPHSAAGEADLPEISPTTRRHIDHLSQSAPLKSRRGYNDPKRTHDAITYLSKGFPRNVIMALSDNNLSRVDINESRKRFKQARSEGDPFSSSMPGPNQRTIDAVNSGLRQTNPSLRTSKPVKHPREVHQSVVELRNSGLTNRETAEAINQNLAPESRYHITEQQVADLYLNLRKRGGIKKPSNEGQQTRTGFAAGPTTGPLAPPVEPIDMVGETAKGWTVDLPTFSLETAMAIQLPAKLKFILQTPEGDFAVQVMREPIAGEDPWNYLAFTDPNDYGTAG